MYQLRLPFSKTVFQIEGNPADEGVVRMLAASQTYEPWIMQTLRRYVKPDAVCVDIGANIGIITLALSVLAEQGRVFAFEAAPENYQFLTRNIATNQRHNVEPLHLAVYDRNGEASFDYVELFAGGAYISETGIHDHRATRIHVPCVRLTDWCRQRVDLSRIDLIKLDVEGAEAKVIAGAQEILHAWQPLLILEMNAYALKTFQGETVSSLYETVHAVYPYIYLIDRSSHRLHDTSSLDKFEQHMTRKGSELEDFICSFHRLEDSGRKRFFFW